MIILEEALSPAAEIFNETNEFPINYNVFLDFVKESKNTSNVILKAKNIVDDISVLATIIEKVYPLVNNSTIKDSLTKL